MLNQYLRQHQILNTASKFNKSFTDKLLPISIHQTVLRFALFHTNQRETKKRMVQRSKEDNKYNIN